ncbi:MAG: beta-N-acetylhexosaminidase [Oscillospiraceae bacterium]|jgi:hexosaminidase|nr:beta-N-acetylhexosaminidase [Oscillospiraceae bacterium]
MKIIPKPLDSASTPGKSFVLPQQISVSCAFDDVCLKAFLERTGLVLGSSADNHIVVGKQPGYGNEEYSLEVSDSGITILASGEKGAINAFASLYQIISENGSIPQCKIHDCPRYQHRGLNLDCARHFFSADEVKRVIEQMSLVKMNVLHWHLADDQGWRIESKRYPKLHEQNEYYSQKEIADIVSFAADRGVEIVPEIDLPGHVTALLAAYPEYSCSSKTVKRAEYGGIYSVVLCPGSEKTYAFVEELLDEICPLFPSARFHLGGDEVPKKEWKKCECCQAKIAEEKLEDETQLQGYFSNRLMNMIDKHGKKAILWNDSLEASNLNKDMLIEYWSVQYADEMRTYADNGGKFIYADMFRFYFDYPHSFVPLKHVYGGPMAVLDTDYAESNAVVGVECCLWTERVETPEKLEEMLFPRIYAVAEVGWSRECKDYEDFKARLTEFIKNHHSLNVKPADMWDPEGESRKQELIAYMSGASKAVPPEIREETMSNYTPNKYFRDAMSSWYTPEDMALMEQLRSTAE